MYGPLPFNYADLRKLIPVQLCSGPEKCRVVDSETTDFRDQYDAILINNKKVTGSFGDTRSFGDAITFETSIHQVSKAFYRSGHRCILSLLKTAYLEGEQKKYIDVFKSGGNILSQSASKR